jgi:hypothetical protein
MSIVIIVISKCFFYSIGFELDVICFGKVVNGLNYNCEKSQDAPKFCTFSSKVLKKNISEDLRPSSSQVL